MSKTTLKQLRKAAEAVYLQSRKLVNPQSSILPYSDSPQEYIEKHLKRFLTPQQKLVCSLINEYPYRVLMRSANNVGKTYLLASLANWFYDCFNPSLCRATATTAPQVDQGFFREFRNLRGTDVNFMPSASVLFDNPNHNVIGFTAKNPDAFQGLHAPNQMFLFDEGTGIDLPFWQRGTTMHQRQKGHYWIAAYNPNDPSSHVVDIEDDDWHIVELNALEHPNIEAELLGLAPPVPSAVRLDVVFSRIKKECQQVNDPDITTDFNFPKGSQYWWRPLKPEFEAQVLGRWPILPTESLLSPKQVFCLGTVHQPVDSSKKLVVSCDVARFGNDKTCIMIRRGLAFLECVVLSKRNGPDIVEKIKELIYKHKVKDEREYQIPIVIDATGGYGGTVQDHLPGYNVIPLTMNAKSPNLLYKNLRSALWFTLHDVILTKSLDCMRFDTQDLHNLQRDLTAPRYRIDETGKKYLEPKNQTKSRLGRSPDLGDTMALSMYELLS